MPIDLANIPGPLIDAVANRNLVPFVGAGLSRQAESEKSIIFPTWLELLSELVHLARTGEALTLKEEEHIENLLAQKQYTIAAQFLKTRIDLPLFEAYIQRRFAVERGKPGLVHRALFKLKTTLIITTNYDLLLETAHVEMLKAPARVATADNAREVFPVLKTPWKQALPLIFKIHGTSLEPHNIVLGEDDYHRLIYRQTLYRLALRITFMTKVILMLGFSFADPDIMEVIMEAGAGFPMPGNYIVLPKGEKESFEKRRLERKFGFQVIEYEASDGHPELLELVEYLASFVPPQSGKSEEF
jgi:hypothetical protein